MHIKAEFDGAWNKKALLQQIKDVHDEFESYAVEAKFDTEYVSGLSDEVDTLLLVDKPKIMVYGIYNSGKSTIINLLHGNPIV